MIYRIELHPSAQQELEETYHWYEERSIGLGVDFLAAVQKRLDRIAKTPKSYPRKKENYREVIVSGYPYYL
jgi:toxin ParE1/3/4